MRSRTRWTHSQLARLCDPDGNVIVDFLGRYERLDEDFALVALGAAEVIEPHGDTRFSAASAARAALGARVGGTVRPMRRHR